MLSDIPNIVQPSNIVCHFLCILTSVDIGEESVEESVMLCVVAEAVVGVSAGLETILEGVNGARVA